METKIITDLNTVDMIVKNRFSVFRVIAGKKYEIGYVEFLNMRLLDIMSCIREKTLSYIPYH